MTTACKICAPALGLIVLLAGAGPLSADPFPLDRVVLTLGAGGGQTVLSGRVLDYTEKGDDNRKLCSLYLSIMDRMGGELDQFGDADARLAGL